MLYNILLLLISCCLQAWILEQYGKDNIMIILQSMSLFVVGIINSKSININKYTVYQAIYYYISILFPYIAISIYPGKASYSLGGLFRTSAPIFILIKQYNWNYKYWSLASITILGLLLSMDFKLYHDSIYTIIGISICMSISSYSSASLGISQQNNGYYLTEIGLISTIISIIQYIHNPCQLNNFNIYILYLIISVMASYSVSQYHRTINYDAFKLSLILSLRRAITCLLMYGLDNIRFIGVIMVLTSNIYIKYLE